MKNALANHDRIASVIEDAVVRGSGYAASEAASTIDKEFILIRKSDLPPVVIKPVYSPARMENIDRPVAGSASLHAKAPASYYWKRVHDIIAIAQYAEAEEKKQAERELAAMRVEAWKMLHPSEALWNYESQSPPSQKQVDVVVNLMRQVDELKEAK